MYRGLACLVLLVAVQAVSAQGNLQRMRAEVAGAPKPPSNDDSKNEKKPDSCDDSDDVLRELFGDLTGHLFLGGLKVLVFPLWLPAVVLNDTEQHTGAFARHPYADAESRFVCIGQSARPSDDRDSRQCEKSWCVRLGLENGNDFNGLNRTGARFAVDTGPRFGLTTNWDYFHERLPGGGTDTAVLGDINFVYRIAQAEWIQMHAGVGARLLTGKGDTFGGFNFTYGADLFPREPVVLSTQFDLGNLNEAFVVRARATVGWQLEHLELFGGYDFLRIGCVNFQGPMLGARLWF